MSGPAITLFITMLSSYLDVWKNKTKHHVTNKKFELSSLMGDHCLAGIQLGGITMFVLWYLFNEISNYRKTAHQQDQEELTNRIPEQEQDASTSIQDDDVTRTALPMIHPIKTNNRFLKSKLTISILACIILLALPSLTLLTKDHVSKYQDILIIIASVLWTINIMMGFFTGFSNNSNENSSTTFQKMKNYLSFQKMMSIIFIICLSYLGYQMFCQPMYTMAETFFNLSQSNWKHVLLCLGIFAL